MMAWYWIVLLSVVGVHFLNTIIVLICQALNKLEGDYVCFMCFTVWFPLYILTYPYREIKEYNFSSGYYKEHGISKIAFLFGKRDKDE